MKNVLLTGGAGYIGSVLAAELLRQGTSLTIVDNFCTSSRSTIETLRRIEAQHGACLTVFDLDICDEAELSSCLRLSKPEAIVHLAGVKSVSESVVAPLRYYEINLIGTLCLINAMRHAGVFHLLFSSSATVYGNPQKLPISEDHPCNPVNPYGRSKRMVEQILEDLSATDPNWRIMCLRYFNPVGAHNEWPLGDSPIGPPANLFPIVAEAASGAREYVSILGDDYPTPDGTGIRDYIHIMDLVAGHVAAIQAIQDGASRFSCVNLGTGEGYSVKEVLMAFEAATGRHVPTRIESRRSGDVPACFADPGRARHLLHWNARMSLRQMCESTWHHHSSRHTVVPNSGGA